MVKLLKVIFVIGALAILIPGQVSAQETNNKYGIHIFDENDLPEAATLVNSSGGEWGYVTVVIREDERDSARWQRAFNQMRRLKLIPIVRIATKMNNSHWEEPTKEEAINWAGFLNSLNWPVKTRYIVLFNEPNHAKEWGGKIDPISFAKLTKHYYETLKGFSGDFFIMAGALDLAAPNSVSTMEASMFFDQMYSEDNFIFTLFDALASHSYPNPGFSASPSDSGRTSIKGYKWEIDYLENFGMDPDIPVFITETGWINSKDNLDENYKAAFREAWTEPQIVAVTPFLLSYSDAPFDVFSWKNPETAEFLPHYYSVQSITKIKGKPEQIHSFKLESHEIADYLVSDSEYLFSINLKNTGQSIWDSNDGFKLLAESTMKPQNIKISGISKVEPGQTAKVGIRLTTNEPRGIHSISIALYKDEQKLSDVLSTQFTLVSPPSVNISANFLLGDGHGLSLLMYDADMLVTRLENLSLVNGSSSIASIKNVIPNKNYRFVLSKPYYLSANRETKLLVGTTNIDFGILLPIPYVLSHFANPLAWIVHFL